MRRAWQSALVLVLGLAVGTVALRADDTKPQHSAVRPVPRQGGPQKRHEQFLERAKKGDVDVLFLGDSITQGWEGKGRDVWKENFEPLKAANFGIGGDRTEHVLWRITEGKELEGIKPKVVVLMIGTNNMGAARPTQEGKVGTGGSSAEEIADGVTAIVKELRRRLPEAKVLLLGIFPRAEKPDAPVRAKVKEVNERIAKLADGRHVRDLDIGAKFLDKDGVLKPEIMPDYLHLSEEGYRIWAAAVRPAVEEMLKK
jgi:lysophospholipase L1-like esterase